MICLYVKLEQLFNARFNSNDNIIPTIKKLSESGKLDEAKKIALLAIILDTLGQMEDEKLMQESLKTFEATEIGQTATSTQNIVKVEVAPSNEAQVPPETTQQNESTPQEQP